MPMSSPPVWTPSAHATPHNSKLDMLLADSVKEAFLHGPPLASQATRPPSHVHQLGTTHEEASADKVDESGEEGDDFVMMQMLRMQEEAARVEAENVRLRKQLEHQQQLMSTMQAALMAESSSRIENDKSPDLPSGANIMPATRPPQQLMTPAQVPQSTYLPHPQPSQQYKPAVQPTAHPYNFPIQLPAYSPPVSRPDHLSNSKQIQSTGAEEEEPGWPCPACTYFHSGREALYLRCACCNSLK